MKFLTLLLVSIVLLSSVDAYRRRKGKQCNNGAEEKVKRNYHWDLQTQERIQKENLETEEIRKNNPEGPNKFKDATEYRLEVRIVDTTTGTEEDFEEKQVKFNNIGTVFIYENHNEIISVTNSISLHDVTNEADQIGKGICCGGVSEIKSGLHIHQSSSSETNISSSASYSCLTINAKNQIWNVCSTNESEVQKFKSDIKTWIIEDWFRAHDLPQPVTIHETPSVQIGIFSIDDQDYWPSTCHGQYQSPININDDDVQEGSVYESVKFDYKSTDGSLQWNEQNFVVTGDFGNFVHTWEYGQREYQAQSLVFKFPSEHTLNGEQHFGELQVSHQSADGKSLVLSFFLQHKEGAGAEGKFFTELNVDIWEQDSQQSPQLKALNLNELLADGKSASVDLNKSYYHYRGSLTSPPCTEGIEHFVFQNTIYVPKQTLETFKSKVVKIGSSTNNRNVNTKFSDLVLYTKQVQDCAQGIPDSIKDLLEEKKRSLERKSSQEAAEQEVDETENTNEPQTQIDGHIIKTTEDVVELKYDTAENPEEAEEQGVDLSNLDSTEKAELRNGGTIQGDFDIPEEQIQEQTNQPENDEEAAEEEVPDAEEQINELAQEQTAAVPELHPTKKHRMKKLMRQRK